MRQRKTAWTSCLAVTMVALVAFTGTAAATTLTSPSGTIYTGTFKAEASHLVMHNASLGTSTTCTSSMLEGKVEQHGAATTASGKLSNFTLSQCGNNHLSIVNKGSLEFHATSGGDGTVTSNGLEITVQNTSIGVSCVYKTFSTHIGTLKGGTPATLQLGSSIIPRTGHSFFCGSQGQWTGSYNFTTPSTLLVD